MEARKSKKSFRQLFEGAEARDDYWAQRAALRYTEAISDRMTTLNMSRAALARALDRSPAYVTKLLRGDVNFTLSTMVRLARVLGAEFQPTLVVKGTKATTRATLGLVP